MTTPSTKLLPIAAAAAALFAAAMVPATAQAGSHYERNSNKVTVYFTRHARKETVTTEAGDASTTYSIVYDDMNEATIVAGEGLTSNKGASLDEVCGDDKCAEVLSDRGELYADLLADFFHRRGIEFDAIYSSHKVRTRQTVQPTADYQTESVVIQLPEDGTELNPQGTSASECPTIDAILSAEPGSTLLVAGHSGTLYDIMGDGNGEKCDGLGLLTDDEPGSDAFPKDTRPGKEGKVANFNDLWKVTIRNPGQSNQRVRLNYRINLSPTRLQVIDRAGPNSRNMH